MKKKSELYKILGIDGRSCNGGDLRWSLPTQNPDGSWIAGEWMPEITGKLEPCENGYHLCQDQDLLSWLNARIFVAEYQGEIIETADKVVVRQARLLRECTGWTEKSARLFACWCARNTPLRDGRTVWDLLTDPRSRTAVEVAERFAKGEATPDERATAYAAARAATWDTACATTCAATCAATRAAARAAACAATCTAASDVAWDAACAAACDAAWAAARDAQIAQLTKILHEGGDR